MRSRATKRVQRTGSVASEASWEGVDVDENAGVGRYRAISNLLAADTET